MSTPGRILLSAAAALAFAPVAALARPVPERFALGVNSVGDTCSASRVWSVKGPTMWLAGDQPFAIACRGISAAQAQGYVSPAGAVPLTTPCGEALTVTLAGLGPVEVRRCSDAKLARGAIDIRFTRRGRVYQGAAAETAVGVLENALRVIAGVGAIPSERAIAKPTVDLAKLPSGPLVAATGQGSGLTAETSLNDGVASLQAGRMLDASRILNDALRQFAGADATTRVDLRLAAGLADSNLSQFAASDQHFAVAGQILAADANIPDGAIRTRQLQVYRGLHLINQRRWTEAVAALTTAEPGHGDLSDPTVITALNQESARSSDTFQSTLRDTGALQRELLEAQRSWALSVAYLALGQVANAETALKQATAAASGPVRDVDPERIVWMRASIERQQGRIAARKGEIEPALANLDCAVAALQGTAPRSPGACVLPAGRALPDTATNAPLLVETQLERASIASRDPARSRAEVLEGYSAAVQSLPDLTGTGTVSLAALERYFGLLTQAPATASRDEEYFRAMQTIGEPAIAREYARLQAVLSASGEVGGLLRQRSDLERQLIRLRYEISAAAPGTADLAALEKERATADDQLAGINARLLSADGIGALEDQPATVASVRDALRPGEVYLKLVALNTAMFGIVISRERTDIYEVKGGLATLDTRARAVLASARTDESGAFHPYDVADAADLYAAIAGPAADTLAAATRVVYNPAGALRQVPLAILVADRASADAYAQQAIKGDYSKVGFVAKHAESAVALSARAFLRSRGLAPSNAPNKFIGFGQNAPPQPAPSVAAGNQMMPFDCPISYAVWANAVGGRKPVSAREIAIAAQALGADGAPEITGDGFTDESLVSGSASRTLDQYQVLHFATHGLPETSVGVDRCVMHLPASLVTTLLAPTPDGQVHSDGLLSFDEVARLRLNANLVVLSACETSGGASSDVGQRGGIERADPALDGLVRSFIAANARAVLATSWRVPATRESDELMAAFYTAGRTVPIGQALRTAQADLMSRPSYASHPYFWGAYFLVGDGEKTMLSPARTAAR